MAQAEDTMTITSKTASVKARTDNSSESGFQPVSKRHPCEVCGKPDWCFRLGIAHCCRRQGSPHEERIDRAGARYFYHRPDEDAPPYERIFDELFDSRKDSPKPSAAKPHKRRRETPPETLDKSYRQKLQDLAQRPEHEADIARLAAELHVPAAALETLGCVFSDGKSRESLREWDNETRGDEKVCGWVFPAFDGEGRVTGLSWRAPNGQKKTLSGGHLGVFLPQGWERRAERTGVLYCVEGPSDTTAMWGSGLAAVGRPSNMAGVDHLAALIRQQLAGRVAIVVVGERDEKSSGLWPGREGALHTARRIADTLGIVIRVVQPPISTKDSREWFVKARPPLDDPAAWAEAGRALESGWETVELVTPRPEAKLSEVLRSEEVELIASACKKAARQRSEEEAAAAKLCEERCRPHGDDWQIAHAMYEAGASCNRSRCVQPVRRIFARGTVPTKCRHIRCKRWCCPGCLCWNIEREMVNVRSRLSTHVRRGGSLYVIRPNEEHSRDAIQRAINRGRGEHFVVQDDKGLLYVSTINANGQPCTVHEAEGAIRCALGQWHAARSGHPISASRNWQAPKPMAPEAPEKIIGTAHKDLTLDDIEQFADEAGFQALLMPLTQRSVRHGILSGVEFVPKEDAMSVRPGGLDQAGAHLLWMLETATRISADDYDKLNPVRISPDNFSLTGDIRTGEFADMNYDPCITPFD